MVGCPDEAAPETEPSWRKAFLLNERNILLIAAWAHSVKDVVDIFEVAVPNIAKRTGVVRRYQRNVNREDTRAVMHVLAREALKTDGAENPAMSLNRLAKIIDGSRREAMVRTLKSVILPTLCDAGYVSGFQKRTKASTVAHDIQITPLGLEAHRRYLERCVTYCAAVEDELRSVAD